MTGPGQFFDDFVNDRTPREPTANDRFVMRDAETGETSVSTWTQILATLAGSFLQIGDVSGDVTIDGDLTIGDPADASVLAIRSATGSTLAFYDEEDTLVGSIVAQPDGFFAVTNGAGFVVVNYNRFTDKLEVPQGRLGADQVALADAAGLFTATNVEAALAEVRAIANAGGSGGDTGSGSGFTFVSLSTEPPSGPAEGNTWFQTDTKQSRVLVGGTWELYAHGLALTEVNISDIVAVGTADTNTVLHGDGTWRVPSPGAGGGSSSAGEVLVIDVAGNYDADNVEAALAEVKVIADAALTDVAVPGDITATGTPTAATVLWGDGRWEEPGDVVARIPMSTPPTPTVGDTRWNINADPPVSSGGGDYGDAEVYVANKAIFQSGTNVTLVPNDGTQTITVNAATSGGSGGDGLGFNALNAVDYGLSTGGTAAANTTALRACVNAAGAARVPVFIPAGTYLVGDNCLTPTLGSAFNGLQVLGEGMHATILEMERGNGASHFFDNASGSNTDVTAATGNATTLRRAKFVDIGFVGGPTDTGVQRGNTNEDCLGFRLFGASDQSFKFIRCRFQTMKGVWHSWGHNNASEIGFTDCYVAHISGWVVRSDNLQALNYYFWNCDVEIVWGEMFWFEDTAYGAQGGGGSVGVFGGSWIIQDDGAASGTVVKVTDNVPVTSVVNFFGTRFEVRNQATVVDGSQGGLLTVNFNGCNFSTIVNTGSVQTVTIKTNQFVGYTRCTFEHNGSYATYVNAGGRLIFNECAVRPTIQSEVATSGGGVSKAKDCYERFNFANTIEWSE